MKEQLAPFKIPLILIGVLLVLFLSIKVVLPMIGNMNKSDSPIVSIEATNKKTYKRAQQIRPADFTVIATRKDGTKSSLPSDSFTIDETAPCGHGEITTITLHLTDDESIACQVDVKNERKELTSYECGKPNLSDVKAVLYSNGELAFEGTGDVMQYGQQAPWVTQYDSDQPIYSVTFSDGVEPVSLDYLFNNLQELTYVDQIPDSVQTMLGTFQGCTAIVNGADWSMCPVLNDISYCYKGCTSLRYTPPISASVINATETFNGCATMTETPKMSDAVGLQIATGMYQNCSMLTSVSPLPPNVQIISSTFAQCVNLQVMPEIPESVTNMASTFSGDSSLKTMTIIPKNVEDCTACFSDCTKASGLLWIDGNPTQFGGCFNNVARATILDLQGNSLMLHVLANTSNKNPNVTVNGGPYDQTIDTREKVIPTVSQ